MKRGTEFANPPYTLPKECMSRYVIKVSNSNKTSDKETEKEDKSICAASKKERRKCPIVNPSYGSCHSCPFTGIKKEDINLGKEGLRGGIEDDRASAAWRKNKLIHGIPHGDD